MDEEYTLVKLVSTQTNLQTAGTSSWRQNL